MKRSLSHEGQDLLLSITRGHLFTTVFVTLCKEKRATYWVTHIKIHVLLLVREKLRATLRQIARSSATSLIVVTSALTKKLLICSVRHSSRRCLLPGTSLAYPGCITYNIFNAMT